MLLTVSSETAVTLKADCIRRTVNADYRDADGIVPKATKMLSLSLQVANYPVNLLDHSLGKDLGFCANLDGGHDPSKYGESFGS